MSDYDGAVVNYQLTYSEFITISTQRLGWLTFSLVTSSQKFKINICVFMVFSFNFGEVGTSVFMGDLFGSLVWTYCYTINCQNTR